MPKYREATVGRFSSWLKECPTNRIGVHFVARTVEKAGFMAMQLARRQALPIILIGSPEPDDQRRPISGGAL